MQTTGTLPLALATGAESREFIITSNGDHRVNKFSSLLLSSSEKVRKF